MTAITLVKQRGWSLQLGRPADEMSLRSGELPGPYQPGRLIRRRRPPDLAGMFVAAIQQRPIRLPSI